MRRTSVMLPHDLRAKAVRHARDSGVTLGELIRRALADAIERGQARDPIFTLSRFPGVKPSQDDHELYPDA